MSESSSMHLHLLLGGLRENIPLASYTTFNIGGPARYLFTANSADDLRRAVAAALECNISFFVMSGGSNILVSDAGFDGLVILNAIKGFHAELRGGKAVITAGAGESWDELVARCVAENWAGLECLSGIPGMVGAAPVQNIGAYGQSVGEVVESIEAVDFGISPLGGGVPPPSGEIVTFSNAQCEFGYRTSIFKKIKGRYIIAKVIFNLIPGGAPCLTYHDLQQYFAGKTPSLAEVRQAVIGIRARKGYVIMEEYECYKTAGSFFTNPIISTDKLTEIRSLVRGCAEPWYWELSGGMVKISAACLVQSAGFAKGYRTGDAGISPKHALSLVNFSNASARDIIALAANIKQKVKDRFSIDLQEEVQLIGF